MSRPDTKQLLALADKGIAEDRDHMVAEGDNLAWLMAQLANWPTRVHEDNTTNMRFLMVSAAATLKALAPPPRDLTNPLQMVCRTCGSAEISADSSSQWSVKLQDWETGNVYDKGHSCEVCEGECRIDEVPLEAWHASIEQPQQIYSARLGLTVEVGVEQVSEGSWIAVVTEEDVGEIYRGTGPWNDAEEAKDAARRWALHESETGSF
jgi:hypothetical protein